MEQIKTEEAIEAAEDGTSHGALSSLEISSSSELGGSIPLQTTLPKIRIPRKEIDPVMTVDKMDECTVVDDDDQVTCEAVDEPSVFKQICTEELIKVSTSTTEPKLPAISHMNESKCTHEANCSVAKECRSNNGRCGLMPTKLAESYYGYVETVEDAVMIVEACRFGRLMRVKRRLLEKERQGIRSGSVFVFVERESGIRRWTDGKVWSPSRICGEFLIYRELESRPTPSNARRLCNTPQVNWSEQVAKILAAKAKAVLASNNATTAATPPIATTNETESSPSEEASIEPANKLARMSPELTIRPTPSQVDSAVQSIRMALAATAASQSDAQSQPKSMVFKKDGLIKKTISLTVANETYHLICYFKDSNLASELLHLTPSRLSAFKNLDICRNPVSYPIMMLQPGPGSNPYYRNGPSGQSMMNNGQYIAIPQSYLHQYSPYAYAGHYIGLPSAPSPSSTANIRPSTSQPQSIASGSVHLPPVKIPASMTTRPAPTDLENLTAGCGSCSQQCPSASVCGKSKLVVEEAKEVVDRGLEEEQLLFCHFLESVRKIDNEQ